MKRKTTGIAVFAVLAFFIFVFAVKAQPVPPHQFYGDVLVSGSPAADGISITAKINGVEYARVQTANGEYGNEQDNNILAITTDDSSTPEKEGGENGDTIIFYVGSVKAQNYTFSDSTLTKLNLEVDSFCGDKVCNSDETTEGCSEDCEAEDDDDSNNPPSGGGSPGGGGPSSLTTNEDKDKEEDNDTGEDTTPKKEEETPGSDGVSDGTAVTGAAVGDYFTPRNVGLGIGLLLALGAVIYIFFKK